MKIINIERAAPYPPIQTWNGPAAPDGWAAFPEEFYDIFYPPDKQAAGFVDITVEDGVVTACTWNEEAYQAYIASLPESEPETDTPTTEERVEALESENHLLQEQVAALSDENDFQEELIVELANIVYA